MKHIILLTLILLISGCATKGPAPSITYYLLDNSIGTTTPLEQDKAKNVMLDVPELSAYLKQSNLVLKAEGQKVTIANYHLWADPLADSIQRAITKDLMSGPNGVFVISSCKDCPIIGISIDHFYPSVEGEVYLSGSFTITKKDQLLDQRFNLRRTQVKDGYSAAVADMRLLLSELSQKISQFL